MGGRRDRSGIENVVMWDPNDVPRRLAELHGLTVELVQKALRSGQLAGDFTPSSRPRTAKGFNVWSESNGELREALARLGWSYNDEDNIPRVISPDGLVVLTAMSGNLRTGFREGEHPQTRRKRGRACFRIVKVNLQTEMVELLPVESEDTDNADAISLHGKTWFVLYYRDGNTVRSEVSCARAVNKAGDLLKWSERIPLPDFDLDEPDPTARGGGDNTPPDVEVPVKRRA